MPDRAESPGQPPEFIENSQGCPFVFLNRKLSSRELEALTLAALGHTSKEIARQMFIAEDTAKKHLQAAREALGATNTANAVFIAMRSGLIKFDAITAN